MKQLQRIRDWYIRRTYEQKTKRKPGTHDFLSLRDAKSICLIINVTDVDPKELVSIAEYLTKIEETGKQIAVVEVNYKSRSKPIFNETVRSIFVNPAKCTWAGVPEQSILKLINKQHFDILINTDTSGRATSRLLAGMSNARTRIGPYTDEESVNYYEMTIQITEDLRFRSLMLHFETYLNMLP